MMEGELNASQFQNWRHPKTPKYRYPLVVATFKLIILHLNLVHCFLNTPNIVVFSVANSFDDVVSDNLDQMMGPCLILGITDFQMAIAINDSEHYYSFFLVAYLTINDEDDHRLMSGGFTIEN